MANPNNNNYFTAQGREFISKIKMLSLTGKIKIPIDTIINDLEEVFNFFISNIFLIQPHFFIQKGTKIKISISTNKKYQNYQNY